VSQIGPSAIALKQRISEKFSKENWLELGVLTNALDLVEGHYRLLRSLDWGDKDYDGNVLDVVIGMLQRDPSNEAVIEKYLDEHFEGGGENISTAVGGDARRVYFRPSVFGVPEGAAQRDLVAVMMPFTVEFDPVYEVLRNALVQLGMRALRVKDIWNHSTIIQDIFELIWSSHIVICDFSQRNANVFYETGIAHTLGKHVIPITQSAGDVPFDLTHHRYLAYLNNIEGRTALAAGICERVRTLMHER
jgi:hypothetical protein